MVEVEVAMLTPMPTVLALRPGLLAVRLMLMRCTPAGAVVRR